MSEIQMSDLAAVRVKGSPNYMPKILFCQAEESAHGRATPQETIGSSPCLSKAWRRDAIRLKTYSYRTEQAYVGWVKRYI